ncbi:MAG: hypothetical protein EZS28_017513 [Streblomastix strix]|uniref:Uncharacterized protein n=1 Tax=Streblomastix strix TaxID=222440 RepID=A0A5J4VWV6_9EUKA|nr:MAG: hypothetical protein EZS28_017513 [Streblomastix strix]
MNAGDQQVPQPDLPNNQPQIVGNLPQALVQAPAAQINPEGALAQLQQLALQGVASPQDKVVKERLAVATKIMEKYYGKKVDELDSTGERDTKHQRQRLEEIEDDCLGLEINKKSAKEKADHLDLEFEVDQCKLAISAQRASAAALHSTALEDYKSATMWTLQAHHIARIIVSNIQPRREAALADGKYKDLLSSKSSAFEAFKENSRKKIIDFAKTQKLLAEPAKQVQQAAIPSTPTSVAQTIQQTPLTAAQEEHINAIIKKASLAGELIKQNNSNHSNSKQRVNRNNLLLFRPESR